MKSAASKSKRLFGICVALLLATSWTTGEAQAQTKAKARAQLQKAGQLKSGGNCKNAIPLYTSAYEVLADAVILFNRAECYRDQKLPQAALDDYEKFLAEFPAAPNKDLVNRRIEEMRTQPGVVGAAGEPVVVAPQPAAKPAPKPAAAPAPVAAPPPEPAPPSAPADRPLQPNFNDDVSSSPDLSLGESPMPEEDKEGGSLMWLWIGLGVAVVAAGVVGGIMLSADDKTNVPNSALGNYRF